MSWEEVDPEEFATPPAGAAEGTPDSSPSEAVRAPHRVVQRAAPSRDYARANVQPEAVDDEPVFGEKIDGLVFAQRSDSPELRWQGTDRRPSAKPIGPPPVARSDRHVAPWEPGPRPVQATPKQPSRLREAWLPITLGLVSLALVVGLCVLFMKMYGFV